MSKLTKFKKNLKCTLDIIHKIVYNVKGYLCAMAAFIIIIVVWAELPVLSSDTRAVAREPIAFELSCIENGSEGELELTVSVKDAQPFCGMLARLDYDEQKVKFLSAELDESLEEKSIGFLTEVSEGEVFFVVDSGENFASEKLLTIRFAPIENGNSICFTLTEISAFKWLGEEPAELNVTSDKVSLVFSRHGFDGEPEISSAELDRGEGQELFLKLSSSTENGFAAGFDVCTLDLSNFMGESYREIAVLCADNTQRRQFVHTLVISDRGRFCVIVKPVVFIGREEHTGKEKVFMIDNGVLIY